jgi:hypothetical protein
MELVQPRCIRLASRHSFKCDRTKNFAGKCLLACVFFNFIGGRRATKIAAKPLAVDARRERAYGDECNGYKNDSHALKRETKNLNAP